MTSFGPISTFAVSSIGVADEPIEFFSLDALQLAIAEAEPSEMMWLNDLTDTLAITLYEVAAPILAMRDLADTLAIIAAMDTAGLNNVAVVKSASDPILIDADLFDRVDLTLEQFFSPAENRGIIVRADQRAAGPGTRHKTIIVGRDRWPIIVGADDRTGKGSGL